MTQLKIIQLFIGIKIIKTVTAQKGSFLKIVNGLNKKIYVILRATQCYVSVSFFGFIHSSFLRFLSCVTFVAKVRYRRFGGHHAERSPLSKSDSLSPKSFNRTFFNGRCRFRFSSFASHFLVSLERSRKSVLRRHHAYATSRYFPFDIYG